MNKTKHTPTPWEYGPNSFHLYSKITGAHVATMNHYDVPTGYSPVEDNAAYIIEAVNLHDKLKRDREALLEALERLLNVPEPMTTIEHFDYNSNAQRLARAAIAAAESEE